jgi:hypothetical protein
LVTVKERLDAEAVRKVVSEKRQMVEVMSVSALGFQVVRIPFDARRDGRRRRRRQVAGAGERPP